MNLYKVKGSPFWRASFSIKGERRRFSTKRANKTEARRVAEDEYHRLLDEAQAPGGKEMTLAEAIERHLGDCRGQKAIYDKRSTANKLIAAGPGYAGRFGLPPTLPLSALTQDRVADLASARRREGNSAATVNKELALLQRIWNVARKEWRVRCVPDLVFGKGKVKAKMRWLRKEEEQALLLELYPWRERKGTPPRARRTREQQRALTDQYDLTVFLLDTGARYAEVAGMTWDMVDTHGWKHVLLLRSKTENGSTIEMTDRLRTVLMWRHAERGNSPYIFSSRFDPRRRRGHATGGIMKAMDRAGINSADKVARLGKATVHSLRDTFASKLVAHGRPLYEVQVLLGHSSPVMTQKYAHLAPPDASSRAAQTLNAMV